MNKKPAPPTSPKNPGAKPQDDDQARPSRHQQREPRLPHERDESSDSQEHNHDERGEQAARDVSKGLQDTGRAPVVEELARRHFPSKDGSD
ncbi:MAG: hypothetical protein ABIR55_14470 [Burkholderiaceae bacterium]